MTAVNRRFVVPYILCLGALLTGIVHANEDTVPTHGAGTYLVFGGTGGTGLEIVKLLVSYGADVTVFVRPTSDRAKFGTLPVSFVVGDALDAESVRQALGAKRYTAVVSSLGSPFLSDHRVDSEGNTNVINGARDKGIARVIMVSSIGAGDSQDAIPGVLRTILGGGLAAKTIAEDNLRKSDLDWTIIRPGNLGDGPSTGTARLVGDPNAYTVGTVPRAEVARLVVATILDEATFRQALNIVQD